MGFASLYPSYELDAEEGRLTAATENPALCNHIVR
jgi:hypothetical protein